MIYPEMSFGLFRDLIIKQQKTKGARQFYDPRFNNEEEFSLNMTYRERIINAIIASNSYKKMKANLKAVRDEMQVEENSRAAELGREPKEVPLILPELDVPGKLLLVQDFIRRQINPQFSIIFAYLYREGEHLGDPLCDQLLEEGGLSSMNIPGFSGNVAATTTRQALEMLYYVFEYPVNLSLFSGVTRSTFNVLEDNNTTIKLTRFQQILLPLSGGLLLRKTREKLDEKVIDPFKRKIKRIVEARVPGLDVGFEVLAPDLTPDHKIDPNRLGKSVITIKNEEGEEYLRLEFRVFNSYGADQEPLNTIIFSQPVYSEDGKIVFNGSQGKLEADLKAAVVELNSENNKIVVKISDAAMNSFVEPDRDEGINSIEASHDNNTTSTGGIDLNSRSLQMDIDGETIDLKFDPAMAAQFQREDFSGVEPIIIQIVPVQNPLALLGVNAGKEEEALAKV